MSFTPEFRCDRTKCNVTALGTDPKQPDGAPKGWFRLFMQDEGFLDFCSLDHMLKQLEFLISNGAVASIVTIHVVDREKLRTDATDLK